MTVKTSNIGTFVGNSGIGSEIVKFTQLDLVVGVLLTYENAEYVPDRTYTRYATPSLMGIL